MYQNITRPYVLKVTIFYKLKDDFNSNIRIRSTTVLN